MKANHEARLEEMKQRIKKRKQRERVEANHRRAEREAQKVKEKKAAARKVRDRKQPRPVRQFSLTELIHACHVGENLASNPLLKAAFRQIAERLGKEKA